MNLKVKDVINKDDKVLQILVNKKSNINKISEQLMVINSIKNEIQLKENINISFIIENKIKKYNDSHKEKNFEQLPIYILKKKTI